MRVAGKREAAEQPVDAGEEASRLRRDAGDVGPIELVAQLPTHLVPGRRAGVIVEAATRNKAEGEKRGWLTARWRMPGAGRAHRSGVVNLQPTLYCSMVIWGRPFASSTSFVATNARSVDSTSVPSTSHKTPCEERSIVLMLRALEDWSTGCRTSSARGEVALGCARLHNSGNVRASARCGTSMRKNEKLASEGKNTDRLGTQV
mgnify:CR=1 FL=1